MTAPAGWFPDPEHPGMQRYFDGEAWTRNWQPIPPPTSAQVAVPSSVETQPDPSELTSTPPGWYPDHTGSLRWWNGSDWWVPVGYLEGAPSGFISSARDGFRHMFTLRGRASRSAYWWYSVFSTVLYLGLGVAILLLVDAARADPWASNAAIAAVALIAFWPLIPLGIRRLHDRNDTGWFILLGLIPGASLVLLIMYTMSGTKGPNRYTPRES